MKIKLVWFRNDIRIHDHEPLYRASMHGDPVIPFYCLDNRFVSESRKNIVLEGIHNLKRNLISLGADLIFREGDTLEALLNICEQGKVKAIYYYTGTTPLEIEIETELSRLMEKRGVELISFWGNTLVSKEDLPFSISHIPLLFTRYRSDVEKESVIHPPISSPESVFYSTEIKSGLIPIPVEDNVYRGGESQALERLNYYIWESRKIDTYEETRNGLSGSDFSTKLSLWLSSGCISPRMIHDHVKRYEAIYGKNKSTYWLIFELMWRDFFRFTALRYGKRFFSEEGFNGRPRQTEYFDEVKFERWKSGMTGIPFIDAGMRELKKTGYLSNRLRQNVASFFIYDLQLPWIKGAEYFASVLTDYDACSNYGNWLYLAGVGNDSRPNRYFNILHQALTYDKRGDYIRLWVPELKDVDIHYLHNLYELPDTIWHTQNLVPDKDYPRPLIRKFWKVKHKPVI